MPNVASIMADLKSKGSPNIRKLYSRHRMAPDRVFGVKVADLKVVAKTIRGQQAVACDLLGTGNMEAMYLAGMVADGSKLTASQLNQYLDDAEDLQMICEFTIPWLAVEHPHARELALSWIASEKEHIAAAGWCTYTGLVTIRPDGNLNMDEIESLLQKIVHEIGSVQNRVRYTMNSFIIAVGTYVLPLKQQAMQAARSIGTVLVDMGETACKVPDAIAHIEKAEAAGKLGKKRKTIRC
jgi:3-methyladenine DNA glycosylase AlkD